MSSLARFSLRNRDFTIKHHIHHANPHNFSVFRETIVPVKNDDLSLSLASHLNTWVSGTKMRKFLSLLHLPDDALTKIVSYGGTQSNSMVALSCLASLKGWSFDYLCPPLSQFYFNPHSHLEDNCEIACRMFRTNTLSFPSHEEFHSAVERLKAQEMSKSTLLVPQGGHYPQAELGMQDLAETITPLLTEDTCVLLASGTGTAALYLAKHLPQHVPVVTVPLIRDIAFLKCQMAELEPSLPSNLVFLDTFERRRRAFAFARTYPEYAATWDLWQKRLKTDFDLIYTPKTLLAWSRLTGESEMLSLEPLNPDLPALHSPTRKALFLHCGGLSGNVSQIMRYRKKGLLSWES